MSIFKRKLKNGYKWRVVLRVKGYPTISKTLNRKEEAEERVSVSEDLQLPHLSFLVLVTSGLQGTAMPNL